MAVGIHVTSESIAISDHYLNGSPTLPAVRLQLRFVLPAVSAALAIVLVLAIVLGGPSSHTASQNGGFDGAAFPASVRAHDFTLSDQHGRSVSLSAYRGKVVALAFLSSDCRTCTLVAQQVRGALDELEAAPGSHASGSGATAPGVRTVFVSTNPRADTRAGVGRFLEETSLSGRVEYLTGASAQLQPIWHAYGIPPASAGRATSEAAATVLLIDRAGVERVGFGLEQITPEGLAHDIRLLQANA
jgi:protein SCO1